MTTAILLAICLGSPHNVWAQGGAFDSTITLQMPFITGETWTVGGAGSFYGDGDHTNANNDYYATDWNRVNDIGAAVLPVADGVVSGVYLPPCPHLEQTVMGAMSE